MAKTLKHIHILGIAGVMTAPLAVALVKKGYLVTGSDQEKIYPPVSDLIVDISINKTVINHSIDLAIIGSSYLSFERCVEEFEQIKKLNIPYISATNYLAQNLVKTNSVLIAGSYGKTTISALVSWILKKNHFKPSYFFGGQLIDNTPSLSFNSSDWSVVEADESVNGLDTQAKFLHYPAKYVILTSTDWEHKESYSSAEANFESFRQLVKKIPADGALIYNQACPDILKLLPDCVGQSIPYFPTQKFPGNLVGQHNQQNISAAFTLCRQLNLDQKSILEAIASFPGIKRRLEKLFSENNIYIYDDFAQSACRVKSALEALHFSHPHSHLKVYFEPHASFLQNQSSLPEFSKIYDLIDSFILGKISFSKNIAADKRVSAKDWQNIFTNKFHYLPTNDSVTDYLNTNLHSGDLLIHFSSGGLDGLNNLKTVYNHIKL